MLVTIFFIALLYLVVQLAYSAVSPPVEEGEKAPLLALGTALLGPLGALLILLAAVTSLAGNLQANMTSSPRVSHALAARERLDAGAHLRGDRLQLVAADAGHHHRLREVADRIRERERRRRYRRDRRERIA